MQAEDEIASIGMVVGAGWNGARAFTATSGPGVSLMTEFIGLAYFAEIPVTIINVQRGGPSTGMPTRTQQADILACAYASHGDTKHVLLFPEDPHECFEHAACALDLADRLQTPVFVMTDLDIGMNQRLCRPFDWEEGARLRPRQGDDRRGTGGRASDFGRYKDVDGDGIPWRTLPGTHPTKGSYFTRGTTRDPYARYSERGPDYIYNMERLLQQVRRPRRRWCRSRCCSAAAAQDPAGRDLFRLHQPGHAGGAGRAGGARASTWTRLRLRAFPVPGQRGANSSRSTSRSSWWSRTATPRCAACWSTSSTSIPRRLVQVLHFDGTPITARFITERHHRARAAEAAPSAPPGEVQHDLHRQAAGCAIPTLETNKVGYTRRDYEGKISTLCAGCGHDSISAAIIQACWELDIEPHRVAKLSGIGCSSKTPDYFLGASHGFNTVHGRMPSVLTGANLANRDLLYLGVSGDGDSASIGLGQFAHAMRRGVRMAYIVENNGVYGLTKGQFSATADQGRKSKKGVINSDSPVDLVAMALQLGATYVARGFSGNKEQLVPLIKGAMSPRRRGLHRRHQPLRGLQQPPRQHQELRLRARAQRGGQPHRLHHAARRDHGADAAPGEVVDVRQHDGSLLRLRSLHADYDPTDRYAAMAYMQEHQARGRGRDRACCTSTRWPPTCTPR